MQSYYATSIPINSSLITNINGWLLGDGCLPFSRTKQTCFSFSTQHEAYANFVSDMLSKNSIPNSIYKTYRKRFDKDYFTVRSFSSMELGELYKKWYSNRVKIVPKDLILHPSTVRNWIMDDGTRHKHSDAMILSTNSFSKNECYSLLEKLKEIVNEGYMSVQNGKNGPRIYLNKISANKLLEYVGSCDVKVFDYKFYKVGV